MAIDYEIEVLSQNSIYDASIAGGFTRNVKVHFSIPEMGVNSDTGILLLLAGYGGYASSNVYKKMRQKFSDQYNLVTVQCNYLGYEFMQQLKQVHVPYSELERFFSREEIALMYQNDQFDFNSFINIGKNRHAQIRLYADLSQENIANFNEMGTLQALDNLVATFNVINILYDNDFSFNTKRIIAYGHSHGAYLSYLCNAFAPNLFSLIIDNSAWLRPGYLNNSRAVRETVGNLQLITVYNYHAKNIITDPEFLDLPSLYKKFTNNCPIIVYQGTTDSLIDFNEKVDFCKSINHCRSMIISPDQVDNITFKSTNHGLDADFISLFDFTMKHFEINFSKDTFLDLQNAVVFHTARQRYTIDYKDVVPKIKMG